MSSSAHARRRVVVGVSGASGALYAQSLVRSLLGLGHEVHLTATDPGKRLLQDELGVRWRDLRGFAGIPAGAAYEDHRFFVYPVQDIGASIASGSFLHDGMVVAPCSAHTLNAVAAGFGDNLLTRAAAVALKERRPLVLLLREAPLTSIDIESMSRLTAAGAIVCPASPGFYLAPRTIDDLVDFVTAKALDLLGIEHATLQRWDGKAPPPAHAEESGA